VVDDLFTLDEAGTYYYRKGVNPPAVIATAVGAVIAMLTVVIPKSAISWISTAAEYSWFIGMGLGLAVYFLLARTSAITATSLRPRTADLPAGAVPEPR
jgi:NCS1 family nucleobase:cation symporter-1